LGSYRNTKAGASRILAPEKVLSTAEITLWREGRILLSRKTLAVVRWCEAISIGGVCELAVVEKLRIIVDIAAPKLLGQESAV
jgi:hypothetical protein